MWAIIPAAGQSQRFADVGYSTIKPLLKVQDRNGLTLSMLAHVRGTLPVEDPYVLTALPAGVERPEDYKGTKTIVIETIGQADTIRQAIIGLPANDAVLIADCDMVLDPIDIFKMITHSQIAEVVVAVTQTFDPNASRVDQIPFPTRFVEKEPISQWGIVGIRIFNSVRKLEIALDIAISRAIRHSQEPYLSMAMNDYPGPKYAHVITNFQDWGTPERLVNSGAKILD